jgi:cytochrome b involved in lipid metabolism
VTLDDLVLDISRFARVHPGGAFALRHNIGRDVSKYFYGGYAMENGRFTQPYRHSNVARKVVNSIIMGRLVKKAPTEAFQITERTKVNELTQTITLTSSTATPDCSLFYKDI